MYELIYSSFARPGLSDDDITGLLKNAQEFNAKNNITGCLLYFNHEFIQVIEGDNKTVKDLYAKIACDKRHSDISLIAEGEKEERAFDEWRMVFHKLSKDEIDNISKDIFTDNLIAFSEIADKPTFPIVLFWSFVKQLLKKQPQQ